MKQYMKELIGLVLFFIAIWAVANFLLQHHKNADSEHDKEITNQKKSITPEDLSDLIEDLIFSETDSIYHPRLQLGLDTILNNLSSIILTCRYINDYQVFVSRQRRLKYRIIL